MSLASQRESIRTTLTSRVIQRLAALNVSERKASLRVEGKVDTLRNLRRGNLPTADRLARIAAALETSAAYLIGETDDPRPRRLRATLAEDQAQFTVGMPVPTVSYANDDYIAIERWNIRYAAGLGDEQPAVPEIKDRLLFRADWVARATDAPPEKLIALPVVGDSMAPTLMDGDTVLVDRSSCDPARRDGIYAVNDDAIPKVKRLGSAGPNIVQLISDNPAYPPMQRPRSEVDVVGRVVWMGRQL